MKANSRFYKRDAEQTVEGYVSARKMYLSKDDVQVELELRSPTTGESLKVQLTRDEAAHLAIGLLAAIDIK